MSECGQQEIVQMVNTAGGCVTTPIAKIAMTNSDNTPPDIDRFAPQGKVMGEVRQRLEHEFETIVQHQRRVGTTAQLKQAKRS